MHECVRVREKETGVKETKKERYNKQRGKEHIKKTAIPDAKNPSWCHHYPEDPDLLAPVWPPLPRRQTGPPHGKGHPIYQKNT